MTKFGQVKAYDEKTGMAHIVFARPDACEKCGACGGRQATSSLDIKADCRAGQWVRVEMPEARFLKAAGMAYALPLFGLLLGLAAGWATGGGEAAQLTGAAIGLGLSIAVMALNERRIKGRPEWTPRLTAVYDEKPTIEDIGCGGGKQ